MSESSSAMPHASGWIALSPDDESVGPDAHVPVWLTNGTYCALATRILPNAIPIRSQYQIILGFEWPYGGPTHFAYAAPPLPKTDETNG